MKNQFLMIFNALFLCTANLVAAWGTKFCRREHLYIFNENFQFMQWQALWIKAFYLQPPAERVKAMLWRVK